MPCETEPGFFCGPGASGDKTGVVCPIGSYCIGGSADKADCTAQPAHILKSTRNRAFTYVSVLPVYHIMTCDRWARRILDRIFGRIFDLFA